MTDRAGRLIAAAALLFLLIVEHGRALGLLPGAAVVVVAIGIGVSALLARTWSALHLGLFILLAAAATVVPLQLLQVSTLQLPLVFVLSLLLLWPLAQVRDSMRGWLRRGQQDGISAFLTLGTPPLTGIALILWARWTDRIGVGEEMVQGLAEIPILVLVLVGLPVFALLNALAEELLYRGLLQQALMEALGDRPLLVVPLQASAFAALHYAVGFPNGALGYLMVFAWGCVLGVLRRRTGGLLAPFLVHVAADLVIGGYLLSLL